MEERRAEEQRLAMEKELRERRWRAAGHIQRFWQGYKIRKVTIKNIQFPNKNFQIFFCRVSKPERKRKPKVERKVAKAKNKLYFFFLLFYRKINS